MKKLLVISMVVVGVFAGISAASAESIATIHSSGWQQDAFTSGGAQ